MHRWTSSSNRLKQLRYVSTIAAWPVRLLASGT